jgi:putative SOS response-associated peptidase YedK
MCGRFVQAQDPATYARIFGAEPVVAEALKPSYNVAPTDEVYAVAEHEGTRQAGTFRWGLIPFWAKDGKIAARHINARAETVETKPAFRDLSSPGSPTPSRPMSTGTSWRTARSAATVT